jgi:hypothetical protein
MVLLVPSLKVAVNAVSVALPGITEIVSCVRSAKMPAAWAARIVVGDVEVVIVVLWVTVWERRPSLTKRLPAKSLCNGTVAVVAGEGAVELKTAPNEPLMVPAML